jgi:hypothetical protein
MQDCAGISSLPVIYITPDHLSEDPGVDGLLDFLGRIAEPDPQIQFFKKNLDKRFRIRLKKG